MPAPSLGIALYGLRAQPQEHRVEGRDLSRGRIRYCRSLHSHFVPRALCRPSSGAVLLRQAARRRRQRRLAAGPARSDALAAQAAVG